MSLIFFYLHAVRLIPETFLNFGAVGAASVTLITWYKCAPIGARQKITLTNQRRRWWKPVTRRRKTAKVYLVTTDSEIINLLYMYEVFLNVAMTCRSTTKVCIIAGG